MLNMEMDDGWASSEEEEEEGEEVGVKEKKKEENAMMEKYLLDMVDSDIIRDYKKYREQS